MTATVVAQILVDKIFCRYGPFEVLLSDRGTNFRSELVSEVLPRVLRILKVNHKLTSGYHPQYNGLTEHYNQTWKQGVRKQLKAENSLDWDLYLQPFNFSYYTTPHAETRLTPFQLTYGDAEGDDSDFEDPPKEKKKVVKEKEKKGIAAKQKSKVAVPGFASKSNAIDAPKPTEDPMSPPSPDLHNLALPFSCAVSVDVVPDENEKKNDRKAYANRQTMIEWAEKAVKEKEMTKRERKALNMDQAKRDHDYYKVMIELGLLENPPPGDVVPMKYIMQKGTKHTVQVKEGVQGEAKFVYMKQYSDVWVNWSHPPFYKYTDADGFEHESPYPGFYLPYDLVRTPKEEEEEDEEEEGGGEEE
uniref:Integrase catalytic domain-containing protein n=1 Tax=Chromera velia CCMP2878 TaxID=1169474 RepID=A0A0K6SAB5_9ALVE|eukprot:Cvel_10036.t2-p1 / transcript=Cvel_10036.t2 / gene=Cvel_10036 / organism=Chromera_velia_CCMP2878 / gene_product=hypothetical protein / transcript_product=hypothetical protein / location=Cvel_scaffold597:4616-12910(-) / protein_length=358 / sequence_SO=supercontig / SO=protein_coding / is_pseudo=false